MSEPINKRDEQIREAARQLSARLATEDGRRAIDQAAQATRERIARTAEAAKLDPSSLQKRVTY